MHPDYGNRSDSLIGGLWAYFAPAGISTQWYWPPGWRSPLVPAGLVMAGII
jgi:hypothetical protein